MKTFSGLVLGLLFGTFFLNRLPSAQASEVSQEVVLSPLRFLLAQYQSLQHGYDPHAMMNKWQGRVLNGSEQMNMRPESDQDLMYGSGTRIYPESSYQYPSQSNSASVAPERLRPDAPASSTSVIAPSYAPQPFSPSLPSSPYPPQQFGPVYPDMGGGYQRGYQPGFSPSPPMYPSAPSQMPPQMPYQQPFPPRSCFCA
ncbi:MAG: hypothetical protein AB7J40_03945 [Candidatus Altimarinota bacterium]